MNKVIEKLIKVAQENPDLEIITMCDNDIFFGDYGWSIGSIVGVDLDYIFQDDETSYITYIGKDDICEKIYEILLDDPNCSSDDDVKEKDIEKRFKKLLQSGDIVKKIIVKVGV